ncbi:MAG: YdcF family protein [Brotaphodocola sp.]
MLVWVLSGGAVICLGYFVAILFYSGPGTSYAIIWLLFSGGFSMAAVSMKIYERRPERIALWIPVSLVTLCAAGTVILLIVQILMFSRIPTIAEPKLDYVIVLGSQLHNKEPGKVLKIRLDKAAEYARENPDTYLILSGGKQKKKKETETEAQVMKQYLMEKGIPEDQLLLEERSTSTAENLAFCKELMGERSTTARIGILTSNFHLYRAQMIAKKQGMERIWGIASESDRLLFFHFSIRDALALLKDRIAGNL